MAIKNILIHLSHDGRSPARQDLAVGFARQHEARQTVSRIPADETVVIGRRSIGVGDLLLSAASDFGADLLGWRLTATRASANWCSAARPATFFSI